MGGGYGGYGMMNRGMGGMYGGMGGYDNMYVASDVRRQRRPGLHVVQPAGRWDGHVQQRQRHEDDGVSSISLYRRGSAISHARICRAPARTTTTRRELACVPGFALPRM